MSIIDEIVSKWQTIKEDSKQVAVINLLNQLYESRSTEKNIAAQSLVCSEFINSLPGTDENTTVHKIICGDFLNDDIVIDKCDLIFTSPPYNANIDYDSYNDAKTIDEYLSMISDFICKCDKFLVDGGRFVINIRDITLASGSRFPIIHKLYSVFNDLKYNYRGIHIWYKGREESSFAWGSWLSSKNPAIIDLFEYVFVFQKSGHKLTSIDNMNKMEFIENVLGVWKIRPVKKISNDKSNTVGHPCPFPVELPFRVIKLYSSIGDVILDPFGGVASTSLAAANAGRNSVSIDISPQYCKTGYYRMLNYHADYIQSKNISVNLTGV